MCQNSSFLFIPEIPVVFCAELCLIQQASPILMRDPHSSLLDLVILPGPSAN